MKFLRALWALVVKPRRMITLPDESEMKLIAPMSDPEERAQHERDSEDQMERVRRLQNEVRIRLRKRDAKYRTSH